MTDMICNIPSPSGSEEIIKKFLKKVIKAEVYEDSIGNLIVHKKGNGKKVMLICGIDEDSLIALSQEKDKVYFNHLGSKKLYPGTPVSINGSEGYICSKEEKTPLENQYIKMFTDDEIPVSASGILVSEYFENDNYIKGSRIGRAVVLNEMIKLADSYTGNFDLYIVFEVQSIFNHKGAVVAANLIMPEITVSFEEIESDENELLFVKAASGYVSSKTVDELLDETSIKPYVDTGLTTSATFVKKSDIAVIGVPVKFSNYASSYVDVKTIAKIKELITKIFKTEDTHDTIN